MHTLSTYCLTAPSVDRRLIDAMFVVGALNSALGRHAPAADIYRSVLALQNVAYGPAAKPTLVTHYYLACDETHLHEVRTPDISLARHVLTLSRDFSFPLLFILLQYEAAFDHFQAALAGFDALFAAGVGGSEEDGGGTDNYWSATSAMSMARLCRTVGNHTLAEELARRALAYYTQQYGSQHELATEAVAFVNALYSHHKKLLYRPTK